jgi:hypothetical protein
MFIINHLYFIAILECRQIIHLFGFDTFLWIFTLFYPILNRCGIDSDSLSKEEFFLEITSVTKLCPYFGIL